MYGPLLTLIILTPLFFIGLFWAFAPYKLHEYHEHRTKYIRSCMGDNYENTFENMKYEIRELKEAGRDEELATLQKHYKKSRFWYKVWSHEMLRSIVFTILCIAVFVFLMWSIIDPLCVRTELAKWEEFTIIAEEVMASSTDEVERAGVVNKMLEYNEWLADARASQRLWGNWSSYYNFDLPEPLLLP